MAKAARALALESHVALAVPRPRSTPRFAPGMHADVRRLFPPFVALSAAVLATPVLLGATITDDWSGFWQLTWLAFDLGLAAALVAVAVSAYRGSPWLEGWAATAGGLLACDAWLDVMTASDSRHMILTGLIAMTLEVPLLALCLLIGSRAGSSAKLVR
jgi:hypothetical protein